MKLIASLLLIFACALGAQAESAPICRQILFKLDLPKDSPEEKVFIEQTSALAALPTVKAFIWLNLAEGKKDKEKEFTHGLRIVFADDAAMKSYVQHQQHRQYIKEVWSPLVKKMQMVDYTETTVTPAAK